MSVTSLVEPIPVDDDDAVGRIERRGVEFIPESERDSRPANVGAVFIGANLALAVVIFGWLPITFGLGFWSAVSSTLVGIAVGTLLIVPLSLFGPRTGTNNPVSSGAHFGINGRLIGSALTLSFALAYAAISVWTGGDALVASMGRLLDTPTSDTALAIGYALITAGVVAAAVFGHANVVALQRLIIPVVGVLMILGIFAFAGDFSASYAGGEYLLGGFWQTWMLAMVVAAAGPISYAPSLGDYTRRLRRDHGDRQIALFACSGVFIGLAAASLFGIFTAVSFAELGDSYVLDLVAFAPGWYVLPILIIGIAGSVGQGAVNLYATGLDMESIIPRLRRVQATIITSVLAIALVFLGTFALDAVDSITAMTLVLNAAAAPWVVVMAIGFLVRRGRYDAQALQRFATGERGGRYWFVGGWNPRAVIAWAAGAAVGLLTVNTTLYVGPWAELADGIDLSLVGSGLVAGVTYLVLLAVWRERESS